MSGSSLDMPGNITPDQLRVDFPPLADPVMYPDTSCAMYLNIANRTLDATRFGDYFNLAIELFAAHFLSLDAADAKTAAKGGILGQQAGAIGSKSVGGVSINYALGYDTEINAGHWNLTVFGKRFYRICKMAGMGGVQVTGALCPDGGPLPGTTA